MAVVLRLSRAGAKKAPFYHIVATDSRKPRDGKFLEQVGTWDPKLEKIVLDEPKVEKWLKAGALPSETVADILKKAKAEAAPEKPAKK
jgi:small subunit ribosomal protein S16